MEDKHTSDFLKRFGKNLAAKRKAKAISQNALAGATDLDVMTISRVERGLSNIGIVNVHKIADALGIHYKELFEF